MNTADSTPAYSLHHEQTATDGAEHPGPTSGLTAVSTATAIGVEDHAETKETRKIGLLQLGSLLDQSHDPPAREDRSNTEEVTALSDADVVEVMPLPRSSGQAGALTDLAALAPEPALDMPYLETIRLNPPRVILLVALDGRPLSELGEVCKQLKSDPALMVIPIIALTPGDEEDSAGRQSIIELADDVLAQPFDAMELLAKMEQYVDFEAGGVEKQQALVDLASTQIVQHLYAKEFLETMEQFMNLDNGSSGAPRHEEGSPSSQIGGLKADLAVTRKQTQEIEQEIRAHQDRLAELTDKLAACRCALAFTYQELEALSAKEPGLR